MNEDFKLAGQLGARGFPTIIMVNEENKGVKIIGARSLQDYGNGLKQVLNQEEELQAKQQPALASLLEKEDLLFSRKIAELYDLEPNEVKAFIQKDLSSDQYELKKILVKPILKKY